MPELNEPSQELGNKSLPNKVSTSNACRCESEFEMNEEKNYVEYRENVESLARMNSDMVFKNHSAAHGSIVLESIFSKSNEIVRMFAEKVSSDVANKFRNYIEAVEKFVWRGGVVKVLHIEDLDSESKIVKTLLSLQELFPSQVMFKKIPKSRIVLAGDQSNTVHFTVGDNQSYRVEVDIKTRESLVCFNDPRNATQLKEVFDKSFNL